MDTNMEARWALLHGLIGPDVASMLSPLRAVEAIPQLADSARRWLLTVAPVGSLDRTLADQETADLEIIAVALDRGRRHGRGWDVLVACQDLGLAPDLPPLPTLTPSEEQYMRDTHDMSCAFAALSVALRTGDQQQILKEQLRVISSYGTMHRHAYGDSRG